LVLKANGFHFDVCYTSVLKRAIKTLWLILEAMDLIWVPVHKTWQLNERHYGALQGRGKTEVAAEVGPDLAFAWRRSFNLRPPPLDPEDPRHPRHDPRDRHIDPAGIVRPEARNNVDRGRRLSG
jgi:2,3-bisphosphoglycerate-dependent phosphoglycerate mutase